MIVLINTNESRGGAAKAAHRLYQELKTAGAEVFLLVKERETQDKNVVALNARKSLISKVGAMIQSALINQNRSVESDAYFTFDYPSLNLKGTPSINQADIINLHWVTHFLSIETVFDLLKMRKPVVWTLHDMASFTGGCHYSFGCEGYMRDCCDCPQLKSSFWQIPYHVLKRKAKCCLEQLVIVTPSKWLADCAKKSRLFKNCRIETIPYGIPIEIFRPIAKEEARGNFGISQESRVLLFCSNLPHKTKGHFVLNQAIEFCLKNGDFCRALHDKKVELVSFGNGDETLTFSSPYRKLGVINDDNKIAQVFAVADFFIMPTLADNLPNVVLESMACGVPCVASGVGGVPDMIEDGENGFLFEPGHPEQLAQKILELTFNENLRRDMGEKARKRIVDNFTLEHQARRYEVLYKELLEENGNALPQEKTAINWPLGQQEYACPEDKRIPLYFIFVYLVLGIKLKIEAFLKIFGFRMSKKECT